MKHLFYCLFLMLLCIGCKGEDDPIIEEKNDPSSATTRGPSGSLDLSLLGNVVSISWNEPFGKYVGIEVGVFTESGMSLGSFSSSNDSGSEKFFVSSIASYSGPVIATVRGRSSNGYVGQPITISLGIMNDPAAPPNCSHGYNPRYPVLSIGVDLEHNFYFSRGEFPKRGLLLYILHVQSFDHYESLPYYPYTPNPVYDVEDITNWVDLPVLTSSMSEVIKISHPQLDRFWDRPDATFTLDIRLYDGGCPKLSHSHTVQTVELLLSRDITRPSFEFSQCSFITRTFRINVSWQRFHAEARNKLGESIIQLGCFKFKTINLK